MTNEERISALEKEVAEIKRGLEARPKSDAIPIIIEGLSQPLPQYSAITEAVDSVTTRFGNSEVVQTKDSITATVQPKECHPD